LIEPRLIEPRRTEALLRPDPSRVVAKIFLPGQEPTTIGLSRAAGVVARCLAMSEPEADAVLDEILSTFGARHRNFGERLDEHFDAVAHRVEDAEDLSPRRRRLIGAYFTQEYALEAAALFNPSVVVHPEQQGLDVGQLRFVLSARAVGEGHVSSIVFRTGVLSSGSFATATVTMDPPSPYVTTGALVACEIDRERFWREADDARVDPETLAFVLNLVPERFTPVDLDRALETLHDEQLTRVNSDHTAASLRAIAGGSYEISFGPETELSERALMPIAPVESRGLEDARFVRFDDRGSVSYLATYTAFDGAHIASRRLQTDDFRTFRAVTFTGRAAADKGLALFPRRIGGRYLALSRWDRENNAIVSAFDGYHWQDTTRLQAPHQPWELIQLGNCGSPIETPLGWLVLTHGVGAMRRYSIGALLLDLDDPSLVLGRLTEPLLRPADDERDGYVPNVVYSCGALLHGDSLLLPYGCSDSTIRFALVDLPSLLARLLEPSVTGRRGTT
jgi:predicted GH43/DUF377 family glycosyl hydrolase